MKVLEPSRASFTAPIEIDIETRTTNERKVRLEVIDRASPNLDPTQVDQESYLKAVEEGKVFFVCLQPLWWTGFKIIRTNVAFSKCTFKAESIELTRPTSNAFVEEEISVPVFFKDGLVYCDLSKLQEDLREFYVS